MADQAAAPAADAAPPEIRPATPQDADFIARAVLLSERAHMRRGIWDVVFPAPLDPLPVLAALVTAPVDHMWHVDRFLVAEVAGERAGCMCGFPESAAGGMVPALRAAAEAAGYDADDAEAGWTQRLAPVRGVMPAEGQWPAQPWSVECVYTEPRFRRRGVSSALMAAVLARGRAAGCANAVILCHTGNHAAHASYVKAGFEQFHEGRTEEFRALFEEDDGFVGLRQSLQ